VIRREEIDSYSGQLKKKLASCCTWSPQLQVAYEVALEEGIDQKIMTYIMKTQTKELIKGLVRELQ